jgi:hypothetical protein
MRSIFEIIGIIGISICFVGFIYQYRARKHLKTQNTSRAEMIKNFKRAPIDDYSNIGKEYLGRADNCAAIGVSMVLAYAIFFAVYE